MLPKQRFGLLLGLLLFLLLAGGCDSLAQRWSGEALPTTAATTLLPQATPETTLAGQPSETPSQAASTPDAPLPSPSPTLKPPTPLPSPSPDPYLTPRPDIPEGEISFLQPAPLSRLTSPMWVIANLAPGAEAAFRVDLLGEDGRLLTSKVLTYAGQRLTWTSTLEFEIAAAAETARLQIGTLDEFGRTQALASTEIILLSVGTDEVFEASDTRERIYITAPLGESINQGGSLLVSGRARPNPLMNLYIELIDEKGKVVGQRTIGMESVPGEDYARFSGEVPFTVTQATPVRLTVYESASRIPGYTHISTRLIVLLP